MPDPKPNQIERLLIELVELKDKLANAKTTLRSYKVQSDRLTQLKRSKKELNAQIEEEKKNIEDEFLEDQDYETASNDELTLKNQIKEKNAELRQLMAQLNKSQDLSTYDYNIKGEPLKVQVQRVVKVYINGKEER
jgi:predicted RNase H-like nuclease (RuvC/YqgF family)